MFTNMLSTPTSAARSALWRESVGFDQLLDRVEQMTQKNGEYKYPPYNISALSTNENETTYFVEVAVAGFHPDELTVEVKNGILKISGEQTSNIGEQKYLHKGISSRAFIREFQLADFVEVVEATVELGVLKVKLERKVPEEMQPKKISIQAR